jgi:hypothetical protein
MNGRDKFIDLDGSQIQFFINKLTNVANQLFGVLKKFDSFWNGFKDFLQIPSQYFHFFSQIRTFIEKIKDLNELKRNFKTNPSNGFSKDIFLKV